MRDKRPNGIASLRMNWPQDRFPWLVKKHSMDAESFTLTVGGLSLDNLERYLVEKHSFKVWSDALSYVYWSVYFLMALFETYSEFEKIFSKKE